MPEAHQSESDLPGERFSAEAQAQMTAIYVAIWEFTAGTTSELARELVAFRWAHLRIGSRTHIVMSEGLAFWASYLARLYILRDRYLAACRDFSEFRAARREKGSGNVEEMIGQFGHEDRIRLEIESFYVSAKLLLERIALVFGFFFDCPIEGRGSAHQCLTERFKKWSSGITGGQKTPVGLYELMKDLSTRVVSFRNAHIEHPSYPTIGVRHWTSTHRLPDGTSYISVKVVSAASKTFQSAVTRHTENPADLISVMEQYIGEMLRYFNTYRSASIFRAEEGTDSRGGM